MNHPVRTLLYELFVEPFLRLLQRLFEGETNVRATRNDMRKAA